MTLDYAFLLDLLKQSPSISLLLIVVVFYNKKIKDYDNHLKECQEMPKVLIASQLATISTQLNILHSRITQSRMETKDEIRGVMTGLSVAIKVIDDRLFEHISNQKD